MYKWEDNIEIDLREMGFGSMKWIDLAQDGDKCWAFVHAVMNLLIS
jgi:hypothetical protein